MFYDTEKAFSLKSDGELQSTFWLFRLINSPALVKLLGKLVKLAIRLNLPVKGLIKSTIFKQFCAGETLKESRAVVNKLYEANVKSILDYSVEAENTNEAFDETLNELLKVIEAASGNPAIPYTSVKLTGLVSAGILEKVGSGSFLTSPETMDWGLFTGRMNRLFTQAFVRNVPIYIDAEESWIQTAIDDLAEKLMDKFNKEHFIVLTTLQMYRHDRLNYLRHLINYAKENKLKLGIKLVRGAYIEKENLRSEKLNYPTPIQMSKERTDEDFNKALVMCLDNIDVIMLCAGTHNEESTLFLLEEMKKRNLPNNHPHIYFSQLYGMSDHISMNLAAQSYNVTKYLPYGPIKSVIPYLLRRADENTGISGQMSREFQLVTQERNRREKQKRLTK